MKKMFNKLEEIMSNIPWKCDGISFAVITNHLENDYCFIQYRYKNKEHIRALDISASTNIKKCDLGDLDMDLEKNNKYIFLYNYVFNLEATYSYSGDDKSFYLFLPFFDKFLGFSERDYSVDKIDYFEFINYFLIKVKSNELFKIKSYDDHKLDYDMEKVYKLDRDITSYVDGPIYDKKKLVKILRKTDYVSKCEEITKSLENFDLVHLCCLTEYVWLLGDAIEKLEPIVVYFSKINGDREAYLETFKKMYGIRNDIIGYALRDDSKREILKKLNINNVIEKLLTNMNNDDLIELSNNTNNFYEKTYFMKYVDKEKRLEYLKMSDVIKGTLMQYNSKRSNSKKLELIECLFEYLAVWNRAILVINEKDQCALLTQDDTVYIPVFTDESQCDLKEFEENPRYYYISFDEFLSKTIELQFEKGLKNVVLNPFTDNFILDEDDLLEINEIIKANKEKDTEICNS